jgi:phage terminase large subunit-like protein
MSNIDRWRADPARFIETILHNPETGEPFKLLPAERDFLAHAFLLADNGRLLYPELIFAAPKKSGKTGFGALFMLTMLLLFGGHYGEGFALANDYEQAASRVFQAIKRIVEASPLLRHEAKITADKVVFPTFRNATITALTSSYASVAGANPVISVFDELWAYDSENSRRLWDEMVPPPTRAIAARLTVTYAGFSGESVLLEELYQRGMAQPLVGPCLHAGDGMLMAWHHDPIAPWQTEGWITEMRRSLRPNQFLRMIENYFTTSESSFVNMTSWDGCVDPNATPTFADKHLVVDIGVDASVKHDSTAIVVVTPLPDKRVRLITHRIFQPTPDEPLDFEATIEATLIDLCNRFAVRAIRFDPYQMAATSQRLQKRGLPVREFAQTVPNLTIASQGLWELIESRGLILYPDAAMRLAASRAIAVETSRGWRIAKEKQSHRIDVVVALGMAAHAAVVVSEAPVPMFGSYDRRAPSSAIGGWASGSNADAARHNAGLNNRLPDSCVYQPTSEGLTNYIYAMQEAGKQRRR